MPMLSTNVTAKDPAKVRAGQAAARKRWGEHGRILRLDELTPAQRRVVMALVDALRVEQAANDAS